MLNDAEPFEIPAHCFGGSVQSFVRLLARDPATPDLSFLKPLIVHEVIWKSQAGRRT